MYYIEIAIIGLILFNIGFNIFMTRILANLITNCFQKLNLEWIYRLTTEKNRFKRFITRIPFFSVLVIKRKILKKY